jgi:hypothetical protein
MKKKATVKKKPRQARKRRFTYKSEIVLKVQARVKKIHEHRRMERARMVSATKLEKLLDANVDGRHLFNSQHNARLFKACTSLVQKLGQPQLLKVYMKAIGALDALALSNLKVAFNIQKHPVLAHLDLRPPSSANLLAKERERMLLDIIVVIEQCAKAKESSVLAVNVLSQFFRSN